LLEDLLKRVVLEEERCLNEQEKETKNDIVIRLNSLERSRNFMGIEIYSTLVKRRRC